MTVEMSGEMSVENHLHIHAMAGDSENNVDSLLWGASGASFKGT